MSGELVEWADSSSVVSPVVGLAWCKEHARLKTFWLPWASMFYVIALNWVELKMYDLFAPCTCSELSIAPVQDVVYTCHQMKTFDFLSNQSITTSSVTSTFGCWNWVSFAPPFQRLSVTLQKLNAEMLIRRCPDSFNSHPALDAER